MRRASPHTVSEIVRLWSLYRCGRAVAGLVGVSHTTAMKYRPRSAPVGPDAVATRATSKARGYQTWSTATRARWDRFWDSDEIDLERVRDLFGVPTYSKRRVDGLRGER